MNDWERDQLIQAVTRWSEHHPTPDLPVVALAHGEELSPRDIAVNLQEKTETGMQLLVVFESATEEDPNRDRRPVTIEQIVEDLDAEYSNGTQADPQPFN